MQSSHVIAYLSLELLFGTHTFNFNCFFDDFNYVFMQIRSLSRLLRFLLLLLQNRTLTCILTLCIWDTPKQVSLQTVKTQMKCCIMLHSIRVYTDCKGKKGLQWIFEIITWHLLICTMVYPNIFVPNQKEESISIQRVNQYIVWNMLSAHL